MASKYATGDLPLSITGEADTEMTQEQKEMFKKANWVKKVGCSLLYGNNKISFF